MHARVPGTPSRRPFPLRSSSAEAARPVVHDHFVGAHLPRRWLSSARIPLLRSQRTLLHGLRRLRCLHHLAQWRAVAHAVAAANGVVAAAVAALARREWLSSGRCTTRCACVGASRGCGTVARGPDVCQIFVVLGSSQYVTCGLR